LPAKEWPLYPPETLDVHRQQRSSGDLETEASEQNTTALLVAAAEKPNGFVPTNVK
jgi:hypothetical protein